jgi:hypothetical protein
MHFTSGSTATQVKSSPYPCRVTVPDSYIYLVSIVGIRVRRRGDPCPADLFLHSETVPVLPLGGPARSDSRPIRFSGPPVAMYLSNTTYMTSFRGLALCGLDFEDRADFSVCRNARLRHGFRQTGD